MRNGDMQVIHNLVHLLRILHLDLVNLVQIHHLDHKNDRCSMYSREIGRAHV